MRSLIVASALIAAVTIGYLAATSSPRTQTPLFPHAVDRANCQKRVITATIAYEVNQDGAVRKATLVKSTGYPDQDEMALWQVRTTRFPLPPGKTSASYIGPVSLTICEGQRPGGQTAAAAPAAG
jgi:TonB family protein